MRLCSSRQSSIDSEPEEVWPELPFEYPPGPGLEPAQAPLKAALRECLMSVPPRPSHYLLTLPTFRPVPTGILGLDKALHGGLIPGAVSVFVGEPGSFKTSITTQIGLDLAMRGHRVVMLLADEPPRSLMPRFYRLIGEQAERPVLEDPFHPAHQRMDALSLTILDRNYTLDEALYYLRTPSSPEVLSVLVVDSLQKIRLSPGAAYMDLRTHVNAVLNRLEDVTQRLSLLTLATSKASREAYGGQRQPRRLAIAGDSSYIESDTDLLVALTPTNYGAVTASIEKNRWKRAMGETIDLILDDVAGKLREMEQQEIVDFQIQRDERNAEKKRQERTKRGEKQAAVRKRKDLSASTGLFEAIQKTPGSSEAELLAKTGLGRTAFKRASSILEEEGKAWCARKKGLGNRWYPAEFPVPESPQEPSHAPTT